MSDNNEDMPQFFFSESSLAHDTADSSRGKRPRLSDSKFKSTGSFTVAPRARPGHGPYSDPPIVERHRAVQTCHQLTVTAAPFRPGPYGPQGAAQLPTVELEPS
jgi:hypothetical protein